MQGGQPRPGEAARLSLAACRSGAAAAHRRPRAAAALLPGKRRQAASPVAPARPGRRGPQARRDAARRSPASKAWAKWTAEELWDTTLDPARGRCCKVHLEDAFKADEMFRTLMGEKVEPRREFIQKHALEVKDID